MGLKTLTTAALVTFLYVLLSSGGVAHGRKLLKRGRGNAVNFLRAHVCGLEHCELHGGKLGRACPRAV